MQGEGLEGLDGNKNRNKGGANGGRGAGDGQALQMLICVLRIKVTIPIFKDEKKEDPITFCKKAEDYMDATDVDPENRVKEFKRCLADKARLWYDEINNPTNWNELMELFCACFCIYSKNSEDWYQYWSSLSFDPASDQEIDNLIHDVCTLAELLHFPEDMVLATLKNMFPQQQMHFFNVNDVQTMYHMLHVMFPQNRNQASNVQASSGASPFAVVHTDGVFYSLPHKNPSLLKNGSKHIQFDKYWMILWINSESLLTDWP